MSHHGVFESQPNQERARRRRAGSAGAAGAAASSSIDRQPSAIELHSVAFMFI
jgi:hypothetical protein